MSTRRERIVELLEQSEHPLTVQDICNRLDIESKSTVYQDLEHIARSLRRAGKQLLMQPAVCNKCGYIFRDRMVASRPTKCPKCKSEWISLPSYMIRSKAK